MAIKYISYDPQPLQGQAVLNCFRRTRRMLSYQGDDALEAHIERGMPLYEVQRTEQVNGGSIDNLLLRGECLSVCAYLKEKGVKVDLVYIDPPFASGADYTKKVYLRKNPKIAQIVEEYEQELPEFEELREFEEKMYGDKWQKERYLNWIYENLLAIRSIMSEEASIYVHLDWHIGHYVKILMDEIFGEQNFVNEIVWHYPGREMHVPNKFNAKHDTIFLYSNRETDVINSYDVAIPYDEEERIKSLRRKVYVDEDGRRWVWETRGQANGQEPYKRYIDDIVANGKALNDVWSDIPSLRGNDPLRTGYATEKPPLLIERIIKASSNEGMTVADFFCGSGVTAAVASKLGRKFITCDVGLNSIETARDRLKNNGAKFDVLEVKDGVTLYRNPAQTMDNIKRVIKGLRNEDSLDKMWEGSVSDSKYGQVPVYIPNLTDPTTRILTKHLMRRIIHEAMPDLPENTKKVKVFYIDVDDLDEIKRFCDTENYFPIEIDFEDLKPKLDNFIMADDARWTLSEVSEGMFKVWQVAIDSFHCDRVIKKIDEYNLKMQEQIATAAEDEKKRKPFTPMTISAEGLECIEWLSLDCTSPEEQDEWHSDVELKIETDSHVRYNNGEKSQNYWDGTIRTLDERKPFRMKIRNICGDETIFLL